jgi:hypothetical protein
VTPADTVAIALMLLFGLVLGGGMLLVLLVVRARERQPLAGRLGAVTWVETSCPMWRDAVSPVGPLRPVCWLAVQRRDPLAVQAALALNDPTPCSWWDGITAQQPLFIAPPVNGWILVMGNGLPRPDDDVDVCFRFLLALSRKLGHVQFFQADRVLLHHAWARAEAGRVVRGYAWANRTLWNQGAKTASETALGLKCFAYDEPVTASAGSASAWVTANVEKVPLLAARWSLNPAATDPRFWKQRRGIAGRPGRNFTAPPP